MVRLIVFYGQLCEGKRSFEVALEAFMTVNLRFSAAYKVEVGAVDDEDRWFLHSLRLGKMVIFALQRYGFTAACLLQEGEVVLVFSSIENL